MLLTKRALRSMCAGVCFFCTQRWAWPALAKQGGGSNIYNCQSRCQGPAKGHACQPVRRWQTVHNLTKSQCFQVHMSDGQ
eukprot:3026754-Amphidinium_carterae.1